VTAEEYLEHAEECERFAAMAKLVSNRNALLASTMMWRSLAADAKARGAGPNPQITTIPKTAGSNST
jgi:hypothetical protein